MVHVRIVRVNVGERRVDVRMDVRFLAVPGEVVGVLMMVIVRVGVRMFLQLVLVPVSMALCQVQPDAGSHEKASGDKWKRDGVAL